MSRAAAVLLATAVSLSLAPPSSAFVTPFPSGALGLHQRGSSRAAAARQLVPGFAGRGGTGVLGRDARRTPGRVGFSMNAPKVLAHLSTRPLRTVVTFASRLANLHQGGDDPRLIMSRMRPYTLIPEPWTLHPNAQPLIPNTSPPTRCA